LPETIRDKIELPRMGLGWAWRMVQKASGRAEEPPAVVDVWRWTGRKYRIRAVLFLLLDALLFAGLGCFTYWLRTGHGVPFLRPGYWDYWWGSFDPTLERQTTLLEFLLHPIPAEQVPLMMVIVGLVLASLTAIPILVSMLYRFLYSLIFTAIIGFVAMLPWLAITVTFCCYLARWHRIRFSFRYATALISLLPMALYYFMATRNTPGIEHLPPLELFKLYLPWVLALIAACAVMAIVLIIARVVNYRPGAIAPLMAVMFATPVMLFETKVGRDELSYRVLERDFGPRSRVHFRAGANAEEIIARTASTMSEASRDPETSLDSLTQLVRDDLRVRAAVGQTAQSMVTRILLSDFYGQKDVATAECRRFLRQFPNSRYVPNALYLEGRAIDLRLDREFSLSQNVIDLKYSESFPNAASAEVWRKLIEKEPASEPASVAMYRLALLEARQGHVPQAIELLEKLIARFAERKSAEPVQAASSGWRDFLAKRPAANSLDIDVASAVQNGRKLLDMLSHNRVKDLEPYYDYPVLRKLLSLDPHHADYQRNLRALLASLSANPQDPAARLKDNIELQLVLSDRSRSRRIDQLKALADHCSKDKTCDVLPQTRFELAAAYQTDNLLDEARSLYQLIQTEHPESPWALEATRRLATMAKPID